MKENFLKFQLEKDEHGYLKNPKIWNRKAAIILAREENILLKKEHWNIILILRNYYQKHQIEPNIKILIHLQIKEYPTLSYIEIMKSLYQLFPKGPIKQGLRIAGLPKPKNCFFFDF